MNLKTILSLSLIAALAPLSAFAQDDDDAKDTGKKEDQPAVDPLATKQEEKQATYTGKGPFPRVADDEETIYAVQRKAYLVRQKIELTPMFAGTFSDRFVQTFAPAL